MGLKCFSCCTVETTTEIDSNMQYDHMIIWVLTSLPFVLQDLVSFSVKDGKNPVMSSWLSPFCGCTVHS